MRLAVLSQFKDVQKQAEADIKRDKRDWTNYCLRYESSVDYYTLYCVGWIEPTLEQLRQEKKVKFGRKEIKINGFLYLYEGEMNDNTVIGYGIARYGTSSFEGTFFLD